MSLLSEADNQRIEQAITRLEEHSAAEFVVAIVPKSGAYSGVRALAAAIWTLATALLVHELFPAIDARWLIAAEVPFALAAWFVLGVPALQRRLIPRVAAEREVRARALQFFLERGLHRTRDATGMLLLISELEHKVTILGDRGVHERVGEAGWKHHVDHVIARIHEGRAGDGVVEVIDELAALLKAELPRAHDDTNELSNRVVRGD